ncbi:TonB-dependent receptor [Sphingomonas sp.]|uniref:TonB-dependent receptor domain-containing protein n=1 Tax=Sphingomonas sp. TaxID=28214 RepID=UPI000DB35183|nr:TonB-dependent receptor [Sphingomonas sp.]PZU10834.1 MAG: TonB-dependent receptor [Sphingomonas sp.]
MKKTRFLGASALAAGALALLPSIAVAQTTPEAIEAAKAAGATSPVTDTDVSNAAIVVTGSRIRQPNLESTVPVTVVAGEELFQSGKLSVGDILNELPQLRNTYSQQNSTRFLGTRGISLIDLYGLGTQRTLVLQNGRRHVAGDILVNGVSPDINTIPMDLLERAEIVTGGNSAIYGSDAIAGVVNFVLKQDYDGIQVRGQSGISDKGDAGNQYVSGLFGKNFNEGRGNIAVNLEYSHQSRYFASGRKELAQNNGLVVVDTDPSGSDGNPDRLFLRDIRSTTISTGGMIALRQPTGGRCGSGNQGIGGAFTCTYLFQPDGSLAAQTGTRVGIGPNGSFLGGNGYSGREGQLITLSPDLKRYSANLLAHYEISPAFAPFVEAKYSRTDAFGSQSGPFFSQGTTLGDPGNRERVRLDNPFLSTQARDLITAQILAAGVDPNSTAATAPALTTAQRTAIANGSFKFNLRRNWVDLGIRDEKIRRETYRIVAGVKGDFNDDWNYEVGVNYGEHKERNLIQGNINVQRYLLAIDTVRNPATGQIVCRSQIDPAARIAYVDGSNAAGVDSILNNDIAACVPLNPFGDGSVSKAARDYLTVASLATGKITQFDAYGFVSGDSSQLFELPGGPVAFSLGFEYRRETNRYDLDDLTQAGYAFYNAIPAFTAPAFEVKELYGELRAPILKDVPFFQELSLSGSARVSDYKGSAGTVWAYGGGVDWKPIEDIKFRGAYSRSVRAPNLSELYSTPSQNFAPAPNDPCSARNIGTGSSTRAANCAAAGRPASYDYVYGASLEIVSGGNTNLGVEKSDSYTAGVVVTPSFLKGFSATVDYAQITVKNVIASVSAQNILNLCYDSPTLDNQFCPLFQRAGASGGPNGEIPFQVLEGSLLQSSLNFAKYRVRVINSNVSYVKKFDFGTVSLNAIWTHYLQNDQFTDPSTPTFKNRLLNELGDPSDRVNASLNFKRGAFTFGYQVRWIDKMYLNTWEDYNALNGQPAQNADYADFKKYPDVFYHDIRFSLDVNEKFQIYVGVDNITDRMPPFGLTGVGAGSGIYDVRGRFGYAGVNVKF